MSWRSLFATVAGVRSFVPFGSLDEKQQKCTILLKEHIDDILKNESRERHLKELQQCIAGYGLEDLEEPINSSCFSQYVFYQTYTELHLHRELFDFLLTCVLNKVCTICAPHAPRFHDLLKKLTAPPPPARIPAWAVQAPIDFTEDEAARCEAFVFRAEWAKQRADRVVQATVEKSVYGPPIRCQRPPPPETRPVDPIEQFITKSV